MTSALDRMARIRLYQVPFFITVAAMPVNWLVQYLGIGLIAWLPELLAMCSYGLLALSGRINPVFTAAQATLLFLLASHIALQVAFGLGAGAVAMFSVASTALIFLSFLDAATEGDVGIRLIRQIGRIYFVHVTFIGLEVALLSTGNAGVLLAVTRGAYKAGVEGYGVVPQSLSLQSQAASQFCAFAAVWFAMSYLSRRELGVTFRLREVGVLLIALIIFALYQNTTMQAVGLVVLFVAIYLTPFAKSVLLRLLFLGTLAVSATTIYITLTYKFGLRFYGVAVIADAFLNPVEMFRQLPMATKLLGAGGAGAVADKGVGAADFGLAVLLIQVGLVVGIAVMISLSIPIWRGLRANRARAAGGTPFFRWTWLAYVNALLSLGNILSLAHYTVSLQSGGRTLFAFHIAVMLFSLKLIARERARPAVPVTAFAA